MSNTFTFIDGSETGGTFSWDSASNWSPTGVVYNAYGQSSFADSFVMGDIGIGSYTATFGDNVDQYANGVDQVSDLTINYAGATLTQSYGGGTLAVADSISLLAGTLDLGYGGEIQFQQPANGSFVIDGVLEGSGSVDNFDPILTGDGTIIAVDEGSAVALDLGPQVDLGLSLQIATGGILAVSSVQSGVTVTVENGANGQLQLSEPADFAGTVAGLAVGTGLDDNPGSFISLPNVGTMPGDTATLTGATLINNTITLQYGINTLGTIALSGNYTGDYVNWTPDAAPNSTYLFLTDTPVCYVAGTRILTPRGPIGVETIVEGDTVIAMVDGQPVVQTVKWVGYRRIVLDRHPRGSELAPIRIRRGALGPDLPARDLLVSPPHGIYIDGKLIPAKLLVNGMTIMRETRLKSVEYYHVELDRHAIIVAEGIQAESYLDTGNRAFFSNGGLALLLHPEFHINAGLACWKTDACAPLEVRPDAVRPIWDRFATRAMAIGYVRPEHVTTTEADIHLLAQGRRIDPVSIDGQRYTFIVPSCGSPVELASRTVVPSEITPYLDDPREIGVAVREVVVRGLTDRREYAADHPALAPGWHAPERLGSSIWRWTNGRGVLPIEATHQGPFIVEVLVSETTTYLLNAEQGDGDVQAVG
jgi:hypothetical protein